MVSFSLSPIFLLITLATETCFGQMNPLRKSFLFLVLFSSVICAGQPKHDSLALNGKASFYHDNFQGLETSNGEYYDKDDFTAAHRTFPFNTFLLVTNKKNKKSVIVRVNDRGPFKKSRVIDLTKSAAMKIEMVPFGVVPVKIEVLTYLDRVPVGDSLFSDGDTWDCHASLIPLTDQSIFVWRNESWKHAFYMATSLALEYKLDSVCIHVSGNGPHRTFIVMVTGIKSESIAENLISSLKKDGFSHSRKFNPKIDDVTAPKSTPPPSDQSVK